MNSIHTGLAAYGMSGEVFHAPLLVSDPNFKLKKIVSRQSEKVHSKYPEIEVLTDFEKLLQDDDIELVVVNTPTHTHFDFAKKALLAGKHVVVEKPFTVFSPQAKELIDLAKKQNKILTVFQNRRWDGGSKTVKQIIEQKLLGKLVEYECHFDRFRNFIKPNSWKEESTLGAGVLYDLGIHLIDEVLQLFGFPKSVMADIRLQRDNTPAVDSFLLLLNYEPHLRVTLKVCYLVREPLPKYFLHGTNGSYIKYGIDPQEEDLKNGKLPIEVGWGNDKEEFWGILNTEINGNHFRGKIETQPGSYQDFYKNLFQAIREGKSLAVNPEEAMDGIKIIEAALESSRLGKVIEL